MSLLKDTKELLNSFKDEDIKILHLIDRVGYDQIISEIKDIDLINDIKEKIPLNLEYLIEDDNIEIVCHLARLENPFIKELAFKDYFKKTLAKDLPVATIDNILNKDIVSGDIEIKLGTYKNPFTGLMVEIKETDSGSYATINKLLDRNLSEFINSININTDDRIIPYKTGNLKDFNLEFIINHELAHITGVQLFNPNELIIKHISLIKENHSDVASILKIISDNNFNKDESIEIINDIIIARSNLKRFEIETFIEEDFVDEHLTQPSLFLLKSFINKDFDYIKNMEQNDFTNFAIILAEEACKEINLKNLSNVAKVIPKNENDILSDLINIKNMDGDNLLKKIILKACKLSGNDELEINIAKKLTNDPFARLDYELRLLCSMSKEELLNLEFPNDNKIINLIKSEFNINKIESIERNLVLSDFFDYKEILNKTENLKLKSF